MSYGYGSHLAGPSSVGPYRPIDIPIDERLQFNRNKGRTPLGKAQEDAALQNQSQETGMDVSSMTLLDYNNLAGSTAALNMTMPMSAHQFDWMMTDPMADPMSMGMVGGHLEVDGKETLHFSGFILVPPPPHAPPRSTREKPPGCKTVFIGGLPETVTEDMIGELMQTCGNIETVRLGKKNFAHVRFDTYDAVDKAIFYSGWRMKIAEKDDKPNTGRIHCDYATARDDQYEYECMQRALERELRHQQRMKEDMNRPPSPPQIARYSESEASNVTEMLKSSEGFSEAANILIQWLEKGYVSNRNANRFYTMLHSVNSSVRRLLGEKEEFERELMKYKAEYQNKVSGLIQQMELIQMIFGKARQQKVWDHFSKPQRKNVDNWIRQCQEIKQRHDDELLAERQEDEMDLSDTEDPAPIAKKPRSDSGDMNSLKDENDSLKCQLEAYKNEVDLLRQESQAELHQKNQQISMLQQTLKTMQQQLTTTKNDSSSNSQVAKSESPKTCADGKTSSVNQDDEDTFNSTQSSSIQSLVEEEVVNNASVSPNAQQTQPNNHKSSSVVETRQSAVSNISLKDGQLIGLITCFLHVHPFGASVDYIWSYLERAGLSYKSSQIESILESYPNIFSLSKHGVGVNFEKRWKFIGFPYSDK